MKNKKILPIANNPLLRGFAHSAFRCAIVQPYIDNDGYDAKISELSFRINGAVYSEYQCDNNAKMDVDNEILCIKIPYNNLSGEKESCFLYINSKGILECTFKVGTFKWNNYWSFSGIKLCGISVKCKEEFRIGFLPNNKIAVIHIYSDDILTTYESFKNEKNYSFLKVIYRDDKIFCYMSNDGERWELYHEEKNFIFDHSLKLGYFLWTDEERYRNWFFSNHILLHASPSLVSEYDVKLDYYTGTKIFDRYDLFNPWIRTNYIDINLVNKDKDFFLQTIKKSVDCGYYVSLYLNEKYIPNTWAYNVKDYYHDNLIYGYDYEKDEIYLVGFNNNQSYRLFTLSTNIFLKSFKLSCDFHDILLMRYELNDYEYALDITTIVKQLQEYLDSTPSIYREDLRINQSVRIYGLSIYDALCKYKTKFSDKRIAYILYEHKQIMLLRVKYFYDRCLISKIDYCTLLELSENLVEAAHKLLMLSIRYNLTRSKNTLDKIEKKLIQLKNNDAEFTKKLISALKDNNK